MACFALRLSGTVALVSFQILDINGIPRSLMGNMSHDHTGGGGVIMCNLINMNVINLISK